ncbi:MAG: response regulator transcription factor [Reyranella sp.]|nr:response regulator transcription factor [Reyranella sp.]
MDQVLKGLRDEAMEQQEMEQLVSALADGAMLVDTNGQIVWIDDNMRRRLNGGLKDLALPARRPDGLALECFLTTAEVVIDGKPSAVCVIQQTGGPKEPRQFIAAIEAVMSDSSWLTRMIVEKFNALRQNGQNAHAPARSSDLDDLTDREREVLWLICEGRTDAEMSERLRLSQNTVRNHIASLYRKIGVNRRSAAIIWARERGITSCDALSPRGSKRARSMRGGSSLY